MRTFYLGSCLKDDTFRPKFGDFSVRKLLLKVCQYVWVSHSRSTIVFKLSTLSLFKTWVRVWMFECVIVYPILKVCLLEFEDVLKVSMPLCHSNEFVWKVCFTNVYVLKCFNMKVWI